MPLHNGKLEIEVFDLIHIHQAAAMALDGRLRAPLYGKFVMGVKYALLADLNVFDYYIQTMHRRAADAE